MAGFYGSVVAITSTGAVALSTAFSVSGVTRLQIAMSSGTAYLGSAAVTTGGFPLTTGDQMFEVTLRASDTPLYAISSQAVAARVLRYQDF